MALLLKGPASWPAGTSTIPGYEGWIDISSLQWGAGRPVAPSNTGGPPQAGRLTFSEITLSKQLDGTTASIAKAMQLPRPIDNMEVVELMDNANIAGLYPALSLKVFNVFVDGYSVSSGGDRPSESISLNFTRITGTTLTPDLKGGNLIKDSWTYDALKG